MKEYLIKCRVKLSGAVCTVKARSETEALGKFNSGKWLYLDTSTAETVDWSQQGKPEVNK